MKINVCEGRTRSGSTQSSRMVRTRDVAGTYLVMGLMLLANLSVAGGDPYAELATMDFGSSSTATAMIEREYREGGTGVYKQVEAKLLAVLAKPEATTACKKTICQVLQVIGSEASVEPLSKLLVDEKTSDFARLALESIPGATVDNVLLNTLKASTGKIQVGVIQTLAARRNAGLADVLKGCLTSGNADLVRASLLALARVGGGGAVEVLKSVKVAEEFHSLQELALTDAAYHLESGDGNKKALEVFGQMYTNGTSMPAIIAAFNGLIDYGPDPVARVAAALKDPRKPLALAAAKATLRIKEEGVTKALCDSFSAVQPEVQVAIVRALAERGDKGGLAVAASALTHSDKIVQSEAISAMEKIGDASVLAPLMSLAVCGNAGAQQALSRIQGANINGLLAGLMDDPDPAKVRIAARVLRSRDDRSALPKLVKMAESDKAEVRRAAIEALDGFADETEVPALIGLLGKAVVKDDEDRIAAILWKAARSIDNEDARFMKLWREAGNSSEAVKVAILPLASAAGGAEPLKVVTDLLGAGPEAMKDRAARTLFKWQNDQAVKPLVELVKGTGEAKCKILGMQAVVRILSDKRCGWAAQQKLESLNQILPSMERQEDKQAVQEAIQRLTK